MNKVENKISRYFELDRHETNIGREVLAGVSTFLALSYIIVVNPAILSEAGMAKDFVFFATVMISALATLAMGLWARLPFALSPGLEMSVYVAFVVVATMGFTWQQALGAVFWSGVLFVILTVTRVRERIIHAIPVLMRSWIAFCVGLFIGLIALRIAGLIQYEGTSPSGFGSVLDPKAIALYVGIGLILLMDKLQVRAGVLISIIAVTVLWKFMSVTETEVVPPIQISSAMLAGFGQVDLSVILNPRLWSIIVLLFVIDFYGSIAKFIGLTLQTGLIENGRLPRMTEALHVDGVATIVGSGVGTTSITTFVESGVGIGVGGRSGLTAVVCGLLLLSCLFIAPLINHVPVEATTGALLFVGVKLAPKPSELMQCSKLDIFALILMSAIVVTTFALDRAMLAGFVIYISAGFVKYLKFGSKSALPDPYLILSAGIILSSTILQIW